MWAALQCALLSATSVFLAGSLAAFAESSAWARYPGLMVATVIFCFLETALIVVLLIQQSRRRRLARALLRSEEWLRLATEGAQLGVWHWNEVTRELSWDVKTREMFGAPPDGEVTLETFHHCLHPDDRERVERDWRYAFEKRLPFHNEYRSQRPDGSIRWIQARGSGYYDQAGEPSSNGWGRFRFHRAQTSRRTVAWVKRQADHGSRRGAEAPCSRAT
jgi:PAS domain S-box-containing protein